MISIGDLHRVYKKRMGDKEKSVVKELENFIDKQLIETNKKAKITIWDFLMIIDKVIGGLTTKDYLVYKKAFKYVEGRLKSAGCVIYDKYAYTKEAMPLRYILEEYYYDGYLLIFPKNGIIIIERY